MILEHRVPHLNLAPPFLRQVGLKVTKVKGVNLAQGLCIMPVPGAVIRGAQSAIAAGHNMYSVAQGIQELRDALSNRLLSFNKLKYSANEIVVTSGSTAAFESVCQAFLMPGDEVITFSPFYPYHVNALRRCRAVMRTVPLKPGAWTFDAQQLADTVSNKTKFIILNTPNNPTGKVFTRAELEQIAEVCRSRNVFCVTDEVYEYMTFNGHQHISIASLPGMFERTITMSSYSKTFAITGWRIGFMAAPQAVADVLRVTFDQLAVCAPTPLQHGVATGIQELGADYYNDLCASYARKQAMLAAAIESTGLMVYPSNGTYFLLADTRERFPGKSSEEVVDILVEKVGVGAVPASDFIGREFEGNPDKSTFLRFSYGVPDEMIAAAAERLEKLRNFT
ncbi:MAG: aminotransferase class I/II-fold pyridoxal phosphate-dependent enzyme [Oligoflexia bacterium]|nr:aminotransferase class I/II-fold pyridoxal phosphate-dependent enzyme [Oligoflexia bacterium]